jgi:predicted signal transduction protein with EAL and GGDEF domain
MRSVTASATNCWVAVARRLSGTLRPGDTLARVSGDEFVIVCEDLADPAQSDAIVRRLDAALRPPVLISGIETNVTASIGIAFTGRGDDTPDTVLHMVDMAMYRPKRAGGGRHIIHDLRDQHAADGQAALEHDMHGLLGRGELHLDYQRIVATLDGSMTGVEALLRWAHPKRGPVSPNVLVPLAERLGMIPAIRQWVLEFPVDIVKIDQVFVAGLGRNAACQSIVAAVIQLAHGLGMTALAEGVETAEQRRELARLGCDSCQGFYFVRPTPATTLVTLIQHRSDGTLLHLPTLDAA